LEIVVLILIGFVFSFSFALIQKKQKIKDNPIAPRVCPAIPPPRRNASTDLQYFELSRALKAPE
jgi:hypothetical protein